MTRGERSEASRAEDQLPRVHVTEALLTLALDTPVRRWVEGVGLDLNSGLVEAARRASVEDALRARQNYKPAVQRQECSQADNQHGDN